MSKESKKTENNPFKGFSLINGPELPGLNNEIEDEIQSGNKGNVSTIEDDADEAVIQESLKKAEKLKKDKETVESTKETIIKKEEVAEVEETKETEQIEEVSTNNEDAPLIKVFADNLYEKGVVDFNSEDPDFDGSEEGVEKLINKTVENRINKWVDTLPDEFSKFLEFVKDGGKPKDFLNTYYSEESWSNFSIDTEDKQKEVIRESLILQGETYEDAEDIINDWETTGKLEVRAATALEKLKKHEISQKELIIKQQKEQAELRKKEQDLFWDNYKKELYSKKDIMGFKVTEKLKNQLWEFISVPEKDGKTKYQKAVENNKDSSLLFALQAMQGFDINKLEKQVNTKVVSKLADKLRNSKNESTGTLNNGRNTQIEEPTNDVFKGFRTLI